jgi:hypothetical protein
MADANSCWTIAASHRRDHCRAKKEYSVRNTSIGAASGLVSIHTFSFKHLRVSLASAGLLAATLLGSVSPASAAGVAGNYWCGPSNTLFVWPPDIGSDGYQDAYRPFIYFWNASTSNWQLTPLGYWEYNRDLPQQSGVITYGVGGTTSPNQWYFSATAYQPAGDGVQAFTVAPGTWVHVMFELYNMTTKQAIYGESSPARLSGLVSDPLATAHMCRMQ